MKKNLILSAAAAIFIIGFASYSFASITLPMTIDLIQKEQYTYPGGSISYILVIKNNTPEVLPFYLVDTFKSLNSYPEIPYTLLKQPVQMSLMPHDYYKTEITVKIPRVLKSGFYRFRSAVVSTHHTVMDFDTFDFQIVYLED
jgi:hypothetical protein